MLGPFFALLLALLALVASPTAVAAGVLECTGDCNGDEVIDENDIVLSIAALFDPDPAQQCPSIVRDPEVPPSAADLIEAVQDMGTGCNQAPSVVEPPIYRTFPGFEVALPIEASDPEGGHLTFGAESLPPGATLDPENGIIHWTPEPDQLGPFCADVSVTDDGVPPQTVHARLLFKVSALDSCTIPSCDPATGCTSTVKPISENCCQDIPKRPCDTMTGLPRFPPQPLPRVAEPDDLRCPEGTVMFLGRNPRNYPDFGRLQNCEYLRLQAASQSGVTASIDVEARCVPILTPLDGLVRMETSDRVHSNRDVPVILQPRDDGTNFGAKIGTAFDVNNITPDYEQREANLTLRVSDPRNGNTWTESVRVILTHCRLDELTDVLPEPCPE